MDAENNIGTIKAAVQPASGSRHPKTCMVILAGNPSTQISFLGSSFHSEERKYMIAEAIDEYSLSSAEAAYEDPR